MIAETTGVILCGGKGTRLRPFTDSMPKPLLPLNGQPILHILLDFLYKQGISRFVLCTGYRADKIDDFVATACPPEWQIRVVNSGEEAEMTTRLRDAWPHVTGRALVCYGDTLANVNIARLERRHKNLNGIATVALYRARSTFGIVRFDRHKRVRQFIEKPILPHWINIGFLLCETNAVAPFLDRSPEMVTFWEHLAASGQLGAYQHSGKHLTINTEKERQDAEFEVVEFLSVLDS